MIVQTFYLLVYSVLEAPFFSSAILSELSRANIMWLFVVGISIIFICLSKTLFLSSHATHAEHSHTALTAQSRSPLFSSEYVFFASSLNQMRRALSGVRRGLSGAAAFSLVAAAPVSSSTISVSSSSSSSPALLPPSPSTPIFHERSLRVRVALREAHVSMCSFQRRYCSSSSNVAMVGGGGGGKGKAGGKGNVKGDKEESLEGKLMRLIRREGNAQGAIDLLCAAIEGKGGDTRHGIMAERAVGVGPVRGKVTASAAAIVLSACLESSALSPPSIPNEMNSHYEKSSSDVAACPSSSSAPPQCPLAAASGEGGALIEAAQRIISLLSAAFPLSSSSPHPATPHASPPPSPMSSSATTTFAWDAKLASLVIRVQCAAHAQVRRLLLEALDAYAADDDRNAANGSPPICQCELCTADRSRRCAEFLAPLLAHTTQNGSCSSSHEGGVAAVCALYPNCHRFAAPNVDEARGGGLTAFTALAIAAQSLLSPLSDASQAFEWLVGRSEARHRSLGPLLRAFCADVGALCRISEGLGALHCVATSATKENSPALLPEALMVPPPPPSHSALSPQGVSAYNNSSSVFLLLREGPIAAHLAAINRLVGLSASLGIDLDEGDFGAVLGAFADASRPVVAPPLPPLILPSSQPPSAPFPSLNAIPVSPYLHHLLLMLQQSPLVGRGGEAVLSGDVALEPRPEVSDDHNAGGLSVVSALRRWAGPSHVRDTALRLARSSVGPNASSAEDSVVTSASCERCGAVLAGHPFTSALRAKLLAAMEEAVVASAAKRAEKRQQQRAANMASPPSSSSCSSPSSTKAPQAKAVAQNASTSPLHPRRDAQLRAEFKAFARLVETYAAGANVYIDAANVGYYGLANWYAEAKRRRVAAWGPPPSSAQRGGGAAAFGGRQHGGGRPMMSPEAVARFEANNPEVFSLGGGGSYVDIPPSFELIDRVASELSSNPRYSHYGFRPLIFIHKRHTEPSNLLPDEMAILDRWRRAGMVLVTPDGMNDDLCWLYGCFYHTQPTDAVAPTTATLAHSPHQQQQRLVYVVTTDLMRDHIFALLDRRAIAQFRDRARIGFSCTFDKESRETRVSFDFPMPFANCSQFDTARGAWHIPYFADCATADSGGEGRAAGASDSGEEGGGTSEGLATGPHSRAVSWLCVS